MQRIFWDDMHIFFENSWKSV